MHLRAQALTACLAAAGSAGKLHSFRTARRRSACWEVTSIHSCARSFLTLRQAGSLASLHGVVLSLERFLSKAMAALEPSSSSGSGSRQSAEAAAQQLAVLAWRRCEWPPTAAAAAEGSGGSSDAGGGSGAGAAAADPAQDAAAALLAHLLDCWSEAGPSQLAEAPELVGAQTLTAILR